MSSPISATEHLARYARAFETLHRNRHPRLGDAPHKPILLLAILDGIERGDICENDIALTPELVATFHILWRALVPEGTWSDKIIYPFRHLVHERFWFLVKEGRIVPPQELGHPTSIGQFTAIADSGRFVDDLWALLQDSVARAVLRKTLLETYFGQIAAALIGQAANTEPLEDEAERLIEEARQLRFRKQPQPKVIREADSAYLRHYLFPRVVKRLYDHQCAVCQMGIRDDRGGRLVDAIHIMPFAQYGNDDPRNGLALCPNHHRAFDSGWFGVTDEYTLRVSSHLILTDSTADAAFLEEGANLWLPDDPGLQPAREALAWHRENVLRM